jgi:hypothetical protein
MGGSSWSTRDYTTRMDTRAATGSSGFDYHDKLVASAPSARKVHEDMDPKKIKGVRESRDSDAHPESLPVLVCFDETGSMGSHPRALQKELGKLMGFLTTSGGVEHPQICFGAVGDAEPAGVEIAPFQIGQFESGLEMDDCLAKLYLEGKGGGQDEESYDLFFYMLARKTSCDSFEKRGKKGYAFLICDEFIRTKVKKSTVKAVFGDDIEADIPIQDIVNEALEKWDIFVLKFPYRMTDTTTRWKSILGERVIEISDPNVVCGVIAGTVATLEGQDKDDVINNLKNSGLKVDANAIVVRDQQAKTTGNLVTATKSSRNRL